MSFYSFDEEFPDFANVLKSAFQTFYSIVLINRERRSNWYDKTSTKPEFTFNLDLPRISEKKKLKIKFRSEMEINLEVLVYLKKVRGVDSFYLDNIKKNEPIKTYRYKKRIPKNQKRKKMFGKILLEQWNLSCSSTGFTSSTDTNSFASSLSLVFRSIISYLKILPTQQLVNKQNVSKTSRFIITIEHRLIPRLKEEGSTKKTFVNDPIYYSHTHFHKTKIQKKEEEEKEKEKVNEKEKEKEKERGNEQGRKHEQESQPSIQNSSLGSNSNLNKNYSKKRKYIHRKKSVHKSNPRANFKFAQIKNGTANHLQIQVQYLKTVDNLLHLMNPVSYSIPKYLDLKRNKSENYLNNYTGNKKKTRRQKRKLKLSQKKETLNPNDYNKQPRQRYLNQISTPIKIQKLKNHNSHFPSIDLKTRPKTYTNHNTSLYSPPFQDPNSYFFPSSVGFPTYFNQQLVYNSQNTSSSKSTDHQPNSNFSNYSPNNTSNTSKSNNPQTDFQTKSDIIDFQISSESESGNKNENENENETSNRSIGEKEPTLQIKIQELESIKLDRFSDMENSFWSVQKIINQLDDLDKSIKRFKK
ncbi:hypothetical protein M0812_13972 [Anaeramoeba flamelloides]|uniref:Autophagy-related protein 13 N-terminal domain-containing protein n=1 Tax=Anaeramoeba flamelloides TaxID=1746091 RepID=A0AAV7ZMQ4_9EUKA|nr:hypothetical protein M0812_13972 [Anaeramoeba flamelloides]